MTRQKRDKPEWISFLLSSGLALIAGLVTTFVAGSQLFTKTIRQTTSEVSIERVDSVRKDVATQAAAVKDLAAKIEAIEHC